MTDKRYVKWVRAAKKKATQVYNSGHSVRMILNEIKPTTHEVVRVLSVKTARPGKYITLHVASQELFGLLDTHTHRLEYEIGCP